MSVEQSIPAVRNIHTKVIFVLVDGSSIHKTTIINPEGKLLTVPQGLFEEVFHVKEIDFEKHFTTHQIQAIGKYFKKNHQKSTTKTTSARVLVPKKRPVTAFKKPAYIPSTVAVCEWTSPRLTFYKHKIDPLRDDQFFRIHLEDGRSYKMKKADFLRDFNEVVVSDEYWKEGAYSYKELPEKVDKFADPV
jgi:hypothetical protein